MKLARFSTIFFSLISAHLAHADTQVNVVGLFSNKAVVSINGSAPKTLSVGQTMNGVKLVGANSQMATLQIEGKVQQLGMGQAASIGSNASGQQSVTLYANPQGHFVSECNISGKEIRFLLDTGATVVAMNSGDAKHANIDYKRGTLVQAGTANGVVTGYRVVLPTLKIGSITLNQVEATVLEGGSPEIILLGMSALNRLEMKRQDIALTLTKRY